QSQPLALTLQIPIPGTQYIDSKDAPNRGRILRNHKESARLDPGPHRKLEADPVVKGPSANLNRLSAGIGQFDELDPLGVVVRIVVNLVDHNLRPAGIER